MEWNDTYILLSLETAWTPLYEAYQAIAAAYHVPFVMQSIEPGERIYYNTDEAHLFFPDRYCVRLYEESLLTPCGLIIGEKLEDGEPFETETDVLERFRDCGYPAAAAGFPLQLQGRCGPEYPSGFHGPAAGCWQKCQGHET